MRINKKTKLPLQSFTCLRKILFLSTLCIICSGCVNTPIKFSSKKQWNKNSTEIEHSSMYLKLQEDITQWFFR